MKWCLTCSVCFLMTCLTSSLWGWEGEGTAESPYLIQYRTDLEYLTEFIISDNPTSDLHFKMTRDIDLTAVDSPNSLIQWRTTREFLSCQFDGMFDGDSHVIYNLNIRFAEPAVRTVFFTSIGDSGVVENLGFENVNILSVPQLEDQVLVPSVFEANNGIIRNCHVTGLVSSFKGGGSGAAGLAEFNFGNGVIENCYTDMDIEYSTQESQDIGGMVKQNSGIMRQCRSYGRIRPDPQVSALVFFYGCMGGMVAVNCGQMIDCSSWVDIESKEGTIGGLIGSNISSGVIVNCYAGGSINSVFTSNEEDYWRSAGGLVGDFSCMEKQHVINCHTDGVINVTFMKDSDYSDIRIGGFAGEINGARIENSTSNRTIRFHAVHSLGTLYVGGFAGKLQDVSIVNSGASGSLQVTAETLSCMFAGGLAGCIKGNIDSSFSQMDISLSGSPYILAGGLAGLSNSDIRGSWAMNRMNVTHNPDTSQFLKLVNFFPYLSVGGLVGMRLKYDDALWDEPMNFSDCRVYGTVNIQSSAVDSVFIDPIFCKKQDDLNVFMVNCQSLARFNRLPGSKAKAVTSPLRKKFQSKKIDKRSE